LFKWLNIYFAILKRSEKNKVFADASKKVKLEQIYGSGWAQIDIKRFQVLLDNLFFVD